MSGDTAEYACPTTCDTDCPIKCHERHKPWWKRDHFPNLCEDQMLVSTTQTGS